MDYPAAGARRSHTRYPAASLVSLYLQGGCGYAIVRTRMRVCVKYTKLPNQRFVVDLATADMIV